MALIAFWSSVQIIDKRPMSIVYKFNTKMETRSRDEKLLIIYKRKVANRPIALLNFYYKFVRREVGRIPPTPCAIIVV